MELINSSLDYLKLGFKGDYDDLGSFVSFIGSREDFESIYQQALEKVRVPLVDGLDLVVKKKDKAISLYTFYIEAKGDFFFAHNFRDFNAIANVIRCDIALDFATDEHFFEKFAYEMARRNWRFMRMKVNQVGNPRDGMTFYIGNRRSFCIRIYDKMREAQKKKVYLYDYLKRKAPNASEYVRLEFEFRRSALRRFGLPEDLSVLGLLPGFISLKYQDLLSFFGIRQFILDCNAKGQLLLNLNKEFTNFARGVTTLMTAYENLKKKRQETYLFDVVDDYVCQLLSLAKELSSLRSFIKEV